jgi:hypothetical protein
MSNSNITLINGPYNNKEIKDLGTVTIRMLISDDGKTHGANVGFSLYEPDKDRKRAFWLRNVWDGTLEGSY